MKQNFGYAAGVAILFVSILFSCHVVRNNATAAAGDLTTNSVSAIPNYPLESDGDLDILVKAIGEARVVFLGESTHGTSEYYTWRTAITKKLIKEKGFDFIAIEGDWDDSYKVSQFTQSPASDSTRVIDILRQYDRWPSSMWGNYEMVPLIEWMNAYNQNRPGKIGFYGLDLYSFWEWTSQPPPVTDTAIQTAIRQVRDFFAPYKNDAMIYADSLRHSKANGSGITKHLWSEVQRYTRNKQPKDEAEFVLYQDACLALNGELFFRTMIRDRVKAINVRETYMAETVKRLLQFYGPHSRAVVWVHNGHAGDAHYSNMGTSGYTSVAEILKSALGRNNIFSVGFGTYRGTVMAGYFWNGQLHKQIVLPAKAGSWEYLLHELSPANKIVLSKKIQDNVALSRWIEFRSIGAAYEGTAIYGRSIIPKRFDAFVFIDSTTALHPINH